MILEELKIKADKAFGALEIPQPSIHWKDKLDALSEQKLQRQYERCLMDMRIEQAQTLGFEPVTIADSR